MATGKGAEFGNNLVNGAVGALGGKYIGGPLGAKLGGGVLGNSAGGMAAGAASSVVGDSINNLVNGDEFDASQMGLGALAGGLGGGSGSAAVHRATDGQAFSGARGLAGDVATNAPLAFGLGAGGNISKDLDAAVNGDPNADKPEDKPGAASDARRDAEKDARELQQQDRPDPGRYGAFG